MQLTYSLLTLTALFMTSSAAPAPAQTITGSGSASGNLTLNATGVFFNTAGTNTPANPLAPGSSNTGSFAGLSSGVIHNLPDISAPGPLVIKSFATFVTSAGTIVFDLQSIAPGMGTSDACTSSAVGSACTPTGSALTIVQASAGGLRNPFSITIAPSS